MTIDTGTIINRLQKANLFLVIGILFIIIAVLITIVFFLQGGIDIMTIFSEIWSVLFWGLLVIGIAMILTWLAKRNKKEITVEPKGNTEKIRGKLEPIIVPRKDAQLLEEFLSTARVEVIFLGVTLEDVVRQHADTISRLLRESKIDMTFMVFNPDSPLLNTMKDAFAPNPSEAVRATLGTLVELKKSLSDVEKQRLEIRICDLVPFNSMICIDAGTEDALMIVEQRLYKVAPRARPCAIITRREQKELYFTYWDNFLFMKSKSKVVD